MIIPFSIVDSHQPVTREGNAGAYAHTYLPGVGGKIWYASGIDYVYPRSEIPQNKSRTLVGLAKPNTFQKDCCDCPNVLGTVI